MPRTIRTKVYKFNELSEDAQSTAIRNLREINVDYGWWEYTYEDAKNIGLRIDSFDTYRRHLAATFEDTAYQVAHNITKNHGESCETYKVAAKFKKEWDEAVADHSDGADIYKVYGDNFDEFDEIADEMEENFLQNLRNEYLSILDKEYEYLTSDEAIKETILANDYEFTANGKIY